MTYKDFAKVEFLPFGESVELIKNRQLDVTLQSAGIGVASIRDLATSVKINMVSIPADVIAKIGDPAYQAGTIPANTYGEHAATPTATVKNFLVTHEGVPADMVYTMTKALFTNLDQMAAAHSAAKAINPADAPKDPPVPLHPGAEKYYREAGLLK